MTEKPRKAWLAGLLSFLVRGTPYLIIDNSDHIWFLCRMARIPRVVAPGFPHYVTQRGKRRQQTFFNDGDYQVYLELMSESKRGQIRPWFEPGTGSKL